MSDVSHIALAAGTAGTARKIQTTAKKFGTFNSPTTGEIMYVDPKHDSEAHHSPRLTVAEAKEAHMRGLIEDYDQDGDAVKGDVDDSVLPIDENDLRLKAVERTAEFAEADDEGGAGSGTLDSRSSTAWEDRERVEGGVAGTAETQPVETSAPTTPAEVDQESADDDAPPAPAKKTTRKSS